MRKPSKAVKEKEAAKSSHTPTAGKKNKPKGANNELYRT
jgi:hypothetical protein